MLDELQRVHCEWGITSGLFEVLVGLKEEPRHGGKTKVLTMTSVFCTEVLRSRRPGSGEPGGA